MRKMKRCKSFKKNSELYELLQSIEERCKIEREHFLNHMKKQQQSKKKPSNRAKSQQFISTKQNTNFSSSR